MADTSRKSNHTCVCGHRVRIRNDGLIPRHSPIKGWRETPWCLRSETRP